VIVAVNKMDSTLPTPWSYVRFRNIREKMSTLLTRIGFTAEQIDVVPVSGISGRNLIPTPENVKEIHHNWYPEKSLIEAINEVGNLANLYHMLI